MSAETFPTLIERIIADRGGALKMELHLIADLELVSLAGERLVLGIPLGSDHAIHASRLRQRKEVLERAIADHCGISYHIEWEEIAAEDAASERANAMEALHDEVEQLPIFGQLQHEFGAELRRGEKRR